MTESLRRLVEAGIDHARLCFGPAGDPTPLAQLVASGSALFSGDAAAGAIGVLMTNDRPTVELVLGAITTGATIVSLPPPSRGADLDAYAAFLRAACSELDVAEIVARDDVSALMAGASLPVRRHADLPSAPVAAPSGAGFRLVQFSSGATDQPKATILDDAALGANVAAILDAVHPEPGDVPVSWLPLSHDMGLIGMLLTSTAAMSPDWVGGGDIVLLDPATFLWRPGTWFEALSSHRGTFTAAPDFGYRLASRHPPRTPIDLTALRCAIVGGEIVRADTIADLVTAGAPSGLRPEAICPAYGMAELGVAATMTRPEDHWQELELSTTGLADGEIAGAGRGGSVTRLVGSGRPLARYEIDCGAGGSTTHPIAVRGPSIGIDSRTGRPLADADGWHRTGDVGFLGGDELYVCGRTDDYVVARGRNIYAPTVELAVGAVDGVRPGRVTVAGLPTGHWAIVAEPARRDLDGPEVRRLRAEIRRAAVAVTSSQPDDVLVVARGSLPLTSSGKLQRNDVARRLLRGDLTDCSQH